jgi:hypothetical protein
VSREFRKKIRAIRDGLIEYANELDEMFPFDENGWEPTAEEIDEFIEEETPVNWTTADEKAPGPYLKDLDELTQLKGLAITGQIKATSALKTYKRKIKEDGSGGGIGLIYNVLLTDPTGDILAVFWDEQVEDAKKFTIGQYVRITNAWKVQKNKMGKLELHPGKFAKIELVE